MQPDGTKELSFIFNIFNVLFLIPSYADLQNNANLIRLQYKQNKKIIVQPVGNK